MSLAEVRLWGRRIGAVSLRKGERFAAFQYDRPFAKSGIEISPITMPLSNQVYTFRQLPRQTFHGLPGLLSDSLPDKFGNALIDTWLASQGRNADNFDAVERLCYTGERGMGALEFAPKTGPKRRRAERIQIDALVVLASKVLSQRKEIHGSLLDGHEEQALQDILRVGTSAGGARAKAVIAWNPQTQEVRSGQIEAGQGFSYWLLKFDGVSENRDKELEDPKGFGAIEYAYSLMAKAAGIEMSECRLLEEGGRRHFMTRRFDRFDGGRKLHMQSLGALCHYDFNSAGANSYEQANLVIRQLGLPQSAVEEQFRRMTFNILARNQDDHVKNIAFLMDQTGKWSLSPAFDLTYSYNPQGEWTAQHQMSMNGKRRGFALDDFEQYAKRATLKRGRAQHILQEVATAIEQWPVFAQAAQVDSEQMEAIGRTHRLGILSRRQQETN